jgi:hypothetical protein
MMHAQWWTALAILTAVGCGGAPVPAERLASAEATTRGAAEVGGDNVPQAALHLKMARDQIAQAKALIQDGDGNRAALVLSRAEADAELALALARENAARAEAHAVLAQVEAIRQQPSSP